MAHQYKDIVITNEMAHHIHHAVTRMIELNMCKESLVGLMTRAYVAGWQMGLNMWTTPIKKKLKEIAKKRRSKQ